MSDTFYALFDSENKLTVTTFDEDELRILAEIEELSTTVKIKGEVFKLLKTRTQKGSCLAITKNANYFKSRKTFEKHLLLLIDTIEPIKALSRKATDELNVSTHRLIHNLTSINAHNIQEIYYEFPQDLITASGKKNISQIANIIESKPKKISSMILRLAKNNVAMKTELSVFKRLYNRNLSLDMGQHKVHRVLMNILYTFFPDFTEKNVNVRIHDSNEQAYLDYETVHVALYHLLDNAVKYTKVDTDIDIRIWLESEKVYISFEMISIVIEDNEMKLIFQEGYSGKCAHKLFKNGHGIGMSRIKEMLDLNQATIEIIREGNIIRDAKNGLDLDFQKNIIKLCFLARKK
ncbi:sensor histidine kinase [Shewanella algae]|uniref:sensor histidine kinase n=1 Tax=Shewanella algae TaxID=38313 RepID=UPI001F33A4DE|nr:ATP-binding protein [Shewanella algae]MCE9784944.1 ATP-binding protein [Shewanella algae]